MSLLRLFSADRREQGEWAEDEACRHLERRGLRVVARNFTTRRGEIDLIMRDGQVLVFVEVRSRNRTDFGDPVATIGHTKQQRISRAAQQFLLTRREWRDHPCRFDVVGILAREQKACEITWLRDAFRLR